jgi:predicted MFS family arabinose efflux permease
VSTQLSPAAEHSTEEKIPRGLIPLLAIACGAIVANIYYAQPLAGPIAHALGLNLGAAGLIVTLTQIGYGLGLLLVVPLGDLIETRRLVLSIVAISFAGLLLAALSAGVAAFLVASLVIGVSSTAVQILVPYAAHIAPAWRRGHVVGQVMSGLLIGIMLSRPTASFIDDLWGWKAVFYVAAGLMAVIGVLLMMLPPRRPTANEHYLALLTSMIHLYRATPVLRRRGLYQAFLFGAFSLFWTTSPLLLAGPQFRLSQSGIALFALAGIAGALAAPLAGRLADKGMSRIATGLAMVAVMAGFVLTRILHAGSWPSLLLLTAGAILVDFGVSSSLVIGQRAIYSLGAEHRSRLNGLFMATFFAGGAACSAAGGWAYAHGGWNLASWIGVGLPIAALLYFATEPRKLYESAH